MSGRRSRIIRRFAWGAGKFAYSALLGIVVLTGSMISFQAAAQYVFRHNGNGLKIEEAIAAGMAYMKDFVDVSDVPPSEGDIMVYKSGQWTPSRAETVAPSPPAGGSSAGLRLNDLLDVAANPTEAGQVLTFNGTGWLAKAVEHPEPQAGATPAEQPATVAFAAVQFPPRTVLPFNLSSCPTGWIPFGQGRFLVGAGNDGQGNTYTVGESGGEAKHVLTADEMPPHTHAYSKVADATGRGEVRSGKDFSLSGEGEGVTGPAGGGSPHENRPPYMAVLYCQKD